MKDYLPFDEKSFSVPPNYFEETESEILLKLKKEENFTTPKDYFESSEEEILNKILEKKPKEKKIFPIRYFAIAASILLVFSLGFFLFSTQEKVNPNKAIVEVNTPNIEESIAENIYEIYLEDTEEIESNDIIEEYYLAVMSSEEIEAKPIAAEKSKNSINSDSKSSDSDNNKTSEIIYDLYFETEEIDSISDDFEENEEFYL